MFPFEFFMRSNIYPLLGIPFCLRIPSFVHLYRYKSACNLFAMQYEEKQVAAKRRVVVQRKVSEPVVRKKARRTGNFLRLTFVRAEFRLKLLVPFAGGFYEIPQQIVADIICKRWRQDCQPYTAVSDEEED